MTSDNEIPDTIFLTTQFTNTPFYQSMNFIKCPDESVKHAILIFCQPTKMLHHLQVQRLCVYRLKSKYLQIILRNGMTEAAHHAENTGFQFAYSDVFALLPVKGVKFILDTGLQLPAVLLKQRETEFFGISPVHIRARRMCQLAQFFAQGGIIRQRTWVAPGV
ncbi:MAG: hypothetical protein RR962_17460 [Hafnia sp.]